MASATAGMRDTLADLTRTAGFRVDSLAASPSTVAELLRERIGGWIVTGGTLPATRSFLAAAHAGAAPAICILPDRHRARVERSLRAAGSHVPGTALLDASTSRERFRLAVAAARAHFFVCDPAGAVPFDAEVVEPANLARTALSPREREVMDLAAAGHTTKSMARLLGVSPNTAKFHLHAAFEKLGASSRTEAVIAAIRRGELAI